MDEDTTKLMAEVLEKARELGWDKSTVWRVKTPAELVTRTCPAPVEYSAENSHCSVVLLVGQDKFTGKFASGILTTLSEAGNPVWVNLPSAIVEELSKLALQSVLARN